MPSLIEITLNFSEFKTGILAFLTAFVVSMIAMPPLIKLIHRFRLFDVPDTRKEHQSPIPTMGGIAIFAGLATACVLWFHFTSDAFSICFFFSIAGLLCTGIMDDLRNLPARYKLAIQIALAALIACSGTRITSFNGLFGLYDLPVAAQYTITILAIAGITNAFNLIDGIDGLAGGIGFMSLVVSGLFLTLSGDTPDAIIAFALSGSLLGFLYFNFNPARIFMGDTGSLILGFVISVLCVRLVQLNSGMHGSILPHIPVFVFSIVAIPVFDTLRVFGLRIWKGRSPFSPDKNHIHHLLTTKGWGHHFTFKLICGIHAILLMLGYLLKNVSQSLGLCILISLMVCMTVLFRKLKVQPEIE